MIELRPKTVEEMVAACVRAIATNELSKTDPDRVWVIPTNEWCWDLSMRVLALEDKA